MHIMIITVLYWRISLPWKEYIEFHIKISIGEKQELIETLVKNKAYFPKTKNSEIHAIELG